MLKTTKCWRTDSIIKENLNLMSKELLKNQVLKNDFIGNISHEIKTPISVIQNYAKILEDSNLSIEERTKYLKNLQEKTWQKFFN